MFNPLHASLPIPPQSLGRVVTHSFLLFRMRCVRLRDSYGINHYIVIFVRDRIAHIVYASIGALLFSFMIYDTQVRRIMMMINGTRNQQ